MVNYFFALAFPQGPDILTKPALLQPFSPLEVNLRYCGLPRKGGQRKSIVTTGPRLQVSVSVYEEMGSRDIVRKLFVMRHFPERGF